MLFRSVKILDFLEPIDSEISELNERQAEIKKILEILQNQREQAMKIAFTCAACGRNHEYTISNSYFEKSDNIEIQCQSCKRKHNVSLE